MEEVSRVCKDQLGLTGCQARSERTQQHHFTCCLVAFCVLERERQDRGLTIYKLKRQLSFHGRTVVLPALVRQATLGVFLQGTSPCGGRPNQPLIPSVAAVEEAHAERHG
jgi:hypothetical protein